MRGYLGLGSYSSESAFMDARVFLPIPRRVGILATLELWTLLRPSDSMLRGSRPRQRQQVLEPFLSLLMFPKDHLGHTVHLVPAGKPGHSGREEGDPD